MEFIPTGQGRGSAERQGRVYRGGRQQKIYGGWEELFYLSGELVWFRKGVYMRFSLPQGLTPCSKHLSKQALGLPH